MRYTESEITQLLHDWSAGDPEALDRLIPLVIEDVRQIAQRYLKHESPAHTLQPTALVNEVYLRPTRLRTVQWKNRAHFLGEMARMMRRLLVDHARRHQKPSAVPEHPGYRSTTWSWRPRSDRRSWWPSTTR